MRTTLARRLISLCALAAVVGCGAGAPTGMVVEISTDLLVPAEVDTVRLRVWNGDHQLTRQMMFDLGRAGPQAILPGRLGLLADDTISAAPITIEATALRKGTEVVHQLATVGFRRGAVVLLRLALLAGCRCHPCPGDQTCEEGPACAPIARDARSLPVYTPRASRDAGGGRLGDLCAGDSADGSASDAVRSSIGPVVDAAGDLPADAMAADARSGDGLDPWPTRDGSDGGASQPLGPTDGGAGSPTLADAGALFPDAPGPDVPAPMGEPGGARPVGDSCTAAAQCLSGSCVDGRCCRAACAGSCVACAQSLTGGPDGECAPVLAGLDPRGDCAADAPSTCGHDGTCDGAGACRLYLRGTRCGPATCAGSVHTPARSCNGAGQCSSASPRACAPFLCNDDGCLTTCTSDAGCATGFYCDGASCVAKKALGAACGAPHECASNLCPVGVCL